MHCSSPLLNRQRLRYYLALLAVALACCNCCRADSPSDDSAAIVARLLDVPSDRMRLLGTAPSNLPMSGKGWLRCAFAVSSGTQDTSAPVAHCTATLDPAAGRVILVVVESVLQNSKRAALQEDAILKLSAEAEKALGRQPVMEFHGLRRAGTVCSNETVWNFLFEDYVPGTDVMTGGRVLVGLNSSGELVVYALHVPAPGGSISKVKIHEEDARTVALQFVAKAELPGTLGPAKLVLSHARAPAEGPVWQFELRSETSLDAILVDAVTGSVIEARPEK